MRLGMTLLTVVAILAGPSLFAADDPFDFSGPLPTTSKRRTAQYFSRPTEDGDTGDRLRLEGSGEQSPYRRAARQPSKQRPSNYAADLFSESRRATAQTPQSVSFGAEMARKKANTAPRDTHQTRSRFDEFLKTRDVVSANYSERSVSGSPSTRKPSAIRQVQMEQGDAFDNLPSLGDLNGNEPQPKLRRPAQPAPTSLFETSPQPAPQPQPATKSQSTPQRKSGRLTEPISTSPVAVSNPFDPGIKPEQPAQRPQPQARSLELNNFGTLSVPAGSKDIARHSNNTKTIAKQNAAAISTAWNLLDPLNVGQECRAELTLTNTGEAASERVSLEVRLPETVRIVRTDPAPVEQQAFLGWKLAGLAGGESQTIRIVFIATAPGSLDLATHVRHTSSRQESYTIAEPQLELALSGPSEVHVGESASQMLIVKNPGTGIATSVTIEALIPAGLEHASGERLQMDIGSLNPGEVRSVRLVMGAVAGGTHILQVQASADSGLVQTTAAEVTVIAPSLRTGITGPSLRYLGRKAEYTIRVLNDGSAATEFVQLNHRIPEGFEFVSADRGARFDRATRVLNWNVGRLESNESLDMIVALLPQQTGEFVHTVRATSDLGAQADAQTTTRVQGAASLVVKVTDLDDPVEVGAETAYEITITNEGTASAHDVGLSCEMPQGLTFLKAQGSSEHRQQGETIGFRPVEELAPGKSLTYRVHIKGDVAGDQRFRCRLTSESLTQPLFTEELTKFYGE